MNIQDLYDRILQKKIGGIAQFYFVMYKIVEHRPVDCSNNINNNKIISVVYCSVMAHCVFNSDFKNGLWPASEKI